MGISANNVDIQVNWNPNRLIYEWRLRFNTRANNNAMNQEN